jgi:hypothetical protein
MTDAERRLLVRVAEYVATLMEIEAPEIPYYGWDGQEPPRIWRDIYDLQELIADVKQEATP